MVRRGAMLYAGRPSHWAFSSLMSCRECWVPFTCPPSWLCIESAPPRGASGRSTGSTCWGSDCTEVTVHCRPVPQAPHTAGRHSFGGRKGSGYSDMASRCIWLSWPFTSHSLCSHCLCWMFRNTPCATLVLLGSALWASPNRYLSYFG